MLIQNLTVYNLIQIFEIGSATIDDSDAISSISVTRLQWQGLTRILKSESTPVKSSVDDKAATAARECCWRLVLATCPSLKQTINYFTEIMDEESLRARASCVAKSWYSARNKMTSRLD